MRTKTISIKITAAILLAAALLLSFAACGKGKKEATGANTFRVAVLDQLDSTNPFMANSKLANEIFLLAYDPLWRYDEKYNPVPCLAESWDVSSDKLTWTIRLRKGVLFSDGVELTSADVKFSYDLIRKNPGKYTRYLTGIESIVCPDDYTVVITTNSVKGDMLYNPTPILPEHIWSTYEDDPTKFDNADLIGTGPFIYQTASSGNGSWTLSANPDYFGGAPHIGQLVFQNEQSAATAATALTTGEVDACLGLTNAQLTTLAQIRGVDLVQSQTPSAGYCILAMNLKSKGLSDQAVRQAIEYCVNREKIFSMAFAGSGTQGSVIFPPGDDFYQPSAGLRTYDLAKAKALLDSAGYADKDKDKIRDSSDGSFKLSYNLYTSADDDWAPAAETILSGDLEDAGLQVNWKTLDAGKDIASACTAGGKWDMFLERVDGDIDPVLTASAFYSGNTNATGWTSSEYDSLYGQLLNALEKNDKVSLCRSMEEMVYEQCPYIVLAYPVNIQAIRSDLWTGYQNLITSSGGLFGTGTYLTYMNVTPNTAAKAKG